MKKRPVLLSIALLLLTTAAASQTNEFTYQGSLSSGGTAANTPHDFEFRLYAADTGGSALGTLQRLNVQVVNGTFAVKLDFGAQFPGANRFLEISVRPAGGGGFQLLLPRQPVSNTPYAVRSLNASNADTAATATSATNATNAVNATNATNAATAANALQLGGVAANQYVLTTDPRMSDARTPTAGSANYVQNTTTPQASSNFNVSGNGTVGGTLSGNVVNAATQYNLGGVRMFTGNGPDNFDTHVFTAVNNFVGNQAGLNTVPNPTPGNSLGKWNSFFGVGAGRANIQGADNSFFGALAGLANTGAANSFFGTQSGIRNDSGILNTFVGWQAGYRNVSGSTNTFIGVGADFNSDNPIGSGNTLLGIGTKVSSGVNNGTAIGGRAIVTQSNSLVLGGISGINGGTDTNVGIGTTAPTERLHVVGSGLFTGNLTINGTLNASLPSNSASYIQNTTTPQSANFNISGNGTIGGGLFVYPTSGNATIDIRNRTNTNYAQTRFFDDAGNYRGYIGYMGANAPFDTPRRDTVEFGTGDRDLTFRPNETELMRLTRTFRVGIGTTNPQELLHVRGNVRIEDGSLSLIGNQPLSLNGNQGQAGQVITSSGAGTAPQWASQTNTLYQRTNMSGGVVGSIAPGASPTQVPGLSQTITVTGAAKLLIQFGVHAFTAGCTGCGPRDAEITVVHNGSFVHSIRQAVAGDNGEAYITGFYLINIGTGNHSIAIAAANDFLTPGQITFGSASSPSGTNLRSHVLVQVIPM